MLDLVENPEDRFSQNEAQIVCVLALYYRQFSTHSYIEGVSIRIASTRQFSDIHHHMIIEKLISNYSRFFNAFSILIPIKDLLRLYYTVG